MKLNRKWAIAALITIVSGTACQQQANNSAVPNNSNVTAPTNTAAKAEQPVSAPAGSPTSAYVAAYNARKNKDISALKALLAKDILEFFEVVGEEEKKSVDDMLKELTDRPQAATAEARNEKIDGDKATIEYLDENGEWRPMDFVKEDGVWKLTLAIGDPQAETPGKSKK